MGRPLPARVGASGTPPSADKANAVVNGTITGVGPTKPFAFLGPSNLAIYASLTTSLAVTAGSNSGTVGSATGLTAGVAIDSMVTPVGTTIGSIAGTTVTMAFPPITFTGSISPSTNQVTGIQNTAGLLGATIQAVGVPTGATVTAIIQASVAGNNNVPGTPGIIQLSADPTVLNPSVTLTAVLTGNAITATATDPAAIFTGAAISYVGTVQLERSFDGGSVWIVCNIGGSGTLAQYAAGTPISLVFDEPENMVAYRLNCIAYTSGTINFRLSENGAAAESLSLASVI